MSVTSSKISGFDAVFTVRFKNERQMWWCELYLSQLITVAALPCESQNTENVILQRDTGSRPSDHYFRSVCLSVCLFVCAEFFSAVFDPISIKLGNMLYVWV